MTTTNVITVDRLNPTTAIWRVRNTTAAGANDYSSTRSFALMALEAQSTEAFPAEVGQQVYDQGWCSNHVASYIERVDFLGRFNVQADDRWPEQTDEWNDSGASFPNQRAFEDFLSERLHHVVLRVEVTDAKYFEGMPEVFESSAYCSWWNDPTRMEHPRTTDPAQLAEIIASL